jgi:hypothetical protein
MVMLNAVASRIVGLARAGKLTSVSVLAKQTPWCYLLKYGNAVLALVEKTHPSNFEVVEPSVADAAGASSSGCKPPRCGACHIEGHKSMSAVPSVHFTADHFTLQRTSTSVL